jgi:hypothetical protein
VAVATLAIMTTQYCPASSIDGLIADSENALSWLFQFSQPSGMEDESLEGPALAAMLQQPAGGTSACRSRVATWEGTPATGCAGWGGRVPHPQPDGGDEQFSFSNPIDLGV